jgi:CRP-like cAMP-binding protein
LAALPAAELASLTPFLKDVVLERGAVLQHPGDVVEQVYFPRSGMISVVVVMRTGEEVETATVGREGALGTGVALGSRRATGRALVQLPGAAARIPAAQFVAAASRSGVIHDIAARYNTLLIAQIQQSVACNALHDAEARLCRWLLSCSDRVNSDTIPLTQEFLGQMLGVRRTTVTIVARMLQAAGMIRYRRGVIQIVDRAALEEGACECYATTRQHFDVLLPEEDSDLRA